MAAFQGQEDSNGHFCQGEGANCSAVCLTCHSLRLLRRSAKQYLSAPGRFVNLKASPRYQSHEPRPRAGVFLFVARVRYQATMVVGAICAH